jgi:phospholipid transport system transporter-binding protein
MPVTKLLSLGRSCTFDQVSTLRATLLDCLSEQSPVLIDASEVEKVDTAGLQLLVAFAIDCMERGIVFGWKARSAVFDRSVKLLGLGALLESPGAPPPIPETA